MALFVLQVVLSGGDAPCSVIHTRDDRARTINSAVKLVLENYPFLMPEPAEKPSLHQEKSAPFMNIEFTPEGSVGKLVDQV